MKDAGAIVGLPYQAKVEKDKEKDKEEDALKRDIWKRAQTHMVVTTLIATITFVVGFTMPGGFIQSGSLYQGMSVLTKSAAFQVFIIFNTIAVVLSTSAIFVYVVASIYSDRDRTINVVALFAMMVAFATGIHAVLANSLALAIATCLVGSCFFLFYIAVIMRVVSDGKQGKLV